MLRRQFFRVAALFAPRWAWGQSISAGSMRELAAVVLPGALGRKGTDQVADDFLKWVREYRDGAQVASGYGHPRTQTVAVNPSRNYMRQLEALGKGYQRAALEAALNEAKVERIPPLPDGRHVASDLLSHFYTSAAGEDFLYGLAIRRDDCRGTANSAERPARFTL